MLVASVSKGIVNCTNLDCVSLAINVSTGVTSVRGRFDQQYKSSPLIVVVVVVQGSSSPASSLASRLAE